MGLKEQCARFSWMEAFFHVPNLPQGRGELQNEEAAALGDKDHSSAGSAIDASRSGGITRIAANLEELG